MKRDSSQKGSVMVEYLVIAVMLMLPIWYFVIGGPGAYNDTQRESKDNPFPHDHTSTENNTYSSSLIHTLDNRGKDFADQIYQP